MNPSRSIALALALLSATVLAGCQTSGGAKTAENRIRVNSGAFHGESSVLGGDIKSILMAGGLDVANPSAPTNDTNRSEIAKSNAGNYDTAAMVAALSETTTRTSSAAQTMKPVTSDAVADAARPSAALAMVAEAKPKPRRKVIMETTVVKESAPVIELASINMSPSDSGEAFDPIPVVEEAKSVPAATALPEAEAGKGARSAVSEAASAPGKTSRIRRF